MTKATTTLTRADPKWAISLAFGFLALTVLKSAVTQAKPWMTERKKISNLGAYFAI